MIGKGLLPSLTAVALFAGGSGAVAQNVGPLEAVDAHGIAHQKLALTPAQERTIYSAVIRQHVRPATTMVPTSVGAQVPPAAELGVLPDEAVTPDETGMLLKYAMVEGKVVVVDPIRMLVVDVIRERGAP